MTMANKMPFSLVQFSSRITLSSLNEYCKDLGVVCP